MIQAANPFLNFSGQANEAIEFYKKAIGAKLEVHMPWSREMAGGDQAPPDIADKVMYAKLSVGAVELELSDVPPSMKADRGTNLHVILHVDAPDEVDALFAALSDGGEVMMPVEDTFWGARYARLTDRFGIDWAIHCQVEQPSA